MVWIPVTRGRPEVEKHRHTAEATLTVNGKVIQAKVFPSEMDNSVDQLHANISRQVRKRKEKLVSRRQRGPRSRPAQTSSELPSLVLTTTRLLLQKLTLMEAVSRLAEQGGELLVFSNVSSNRIQVVRRLGGGGIELIDPQPE